MLKMANSVKASAIAREGREALVALLGEVPWLGRVRNERVSGGMRVDFALRVEGIEWVIVAQARRIGQPRVARECCLELAEVARRDGSVYPVFIAPYVSPAAAGICAEFGVGYLDLAGNCRLAFDPVYIRKEGVLKQKAAARDLRSLYSPKAERMLRAMVNAGPRMLRMQELAEEAQVSLGQVAGVKKLLVDREWIETGSAGFCLVKRAVAPLLQEWGRAYRSGRNVVSEFYSMKAVPEIEAGLVRAANDAGVELAFGGFAGAARVAPAVRYQRVSAYVSGDVEAVARRAGLKRVESGANVVLVEPGDVGVFLGGRVVERAPVVSAVQLYLDLIQLKGRGDEAAQAVLEGVIQPLWR
jgi:hypothetical protein